MRPLEALDRIEQTAPRIAVIGDFMLDGWWTGGVHRVAREAPAPVFEIAQRAEQPGGAGNAAANLAALGCRVRAVGMIGDDAAGSRLRRALDDLGIDTTSLAATGVPTQQKSRIVSAEQLLLRVDEGGGEQGATDTAAFVRSALNAAADADAVLICDYGSAAMSALADDPHLSEIAAAHTIVDAHDPTRWRALSPEVITPNAAEAERVLGSGAPVHGRAAFFARNAHRLRAATGATIVVVTLDRDGAVALGEHPHRTHAHPALEQRASGAGDTFAASLTASLAAGCELAVAMDVAQSAADVTVHKQGTSVCSTAELASWLDDGPDPVTDRDVLLRTLDERRARGERIVLTNGCFDVLHSGHTHYLRQAKRLGDVLVVAVNDDASVCRLKGPDRPINPAIDRAKVLAALECVDHVTVFSEDTPSDLIAAVRPDVYAKGGDYTPEMLEETAIVRAGGGEVVIADYVADHSTTALVDRIQAGARERT